MRRDRLPTILGGAVLALAGCDRPAPVNPPAAGPAGPTITVVKPARVAIRRVIEQPGAVEAFEETDLFARLPGYVRAVAEDPAKKARPPHDRLIDIGSRVTAGQVLVVLAVPEVEEEGKQKEAPLRQAAAEVEQARKAVAAAEAGITSAEAQVTETRAGLGRTAALYDRWEQEAGRIGELVKGGVIDAQTRDETENQFKAARAARDEAAAKVASAQAAVRKAQADRDKATADVAAAAARHDVAKAEARRLAALLGYAKLVAPFDGVVTRRGVDTGDFLQPGGTRAVFAVARLDPVRVVVRVPEADAGLVREGLPVRVTVQAIPGPELTGTVARTAWSLEPGSRTLRTEIDLPNPDGRVRPGMYVYAKVTAELPEAWAVPAAAVGKAGDDFVVYLAENGKAVRVPVQVLRGDGTHTQLRRVKKPGAADWSEVTGELSVAAPAAALTDGQPIPGPGTGR